MIFSIIIWINMIMDQANLAVTIIGWIQFGLLTITIGLPILLLLIVLVIPVKYDLKGVLSEAKEFPDDETEGTDESGGDSDSIKKTITEVLYKVTDCIKGKGKFSWLSRFIKGEVCYKDRELSWKARIFIKKLSSQDVSSQEDEEDKEVDKENNELEKKSSVSIENNELEKKSSVSIEKNEPEKKSGVSLENRQEVKVSKSQDILERVSAKKAQKESVKGEDSKRGSVKGEDSKKESYSKEVEDRKKEGYNKEEEGRKKERYNKEEGYVKEDIFEEEDDNIIDKAEDFFEKIEEGYDKINEKIEYTYEQICDKIDLVSEGKEKISQFIDDETHREAYNVLIKSLKQLLRGMKPTKIRGNLKVGFEDPKTTGLFVAGASLLYPYTNGNAKLEADFEQKVLEGDLCIKGKLRLGSLAWFATKLAINKNVQVTIKDIIKNVPKDLNIKKT
jgi:hypothetical protein